MRIAQKFARRISSDRFDSAMGQLACWGTSILILAMGLLKLASLAPTETELFFGLMLVLAVALLCVNLGFLLRIESTFCRHGND